MVGCRGSGLAPKSLSCQLWRCSHSNSPLTSGFITVRRSRPFQLPATKRPIALPSTGVFPWRYKVNLMWAGYWCLEQKLEDVIVWSLTGKEIDK